MRTKRFIDREDTKLLYLIQFTAYLIQLTAEK
jgi:hypothetical protein